MNKVNRKKSIIVWQLAFLLMAGQGILAPIATKGWESREVYANTRFQKKEVNAYGTITYEHFRLIDSLETQSVVTDEKDVQLNQTYYIAESYTKGIQTYYPIETTQGKRLGYISASSITLVGDQSEGKKQSIVERKEVVQEGVLIYEDFSWQKKGSTTDFINQVLRLKGAYHHVNGKVYYEAYNKEDEWLGLIPEEAFVKLESDETVEEPTEESTTATSQSDEVNETTEETQTSVSTEEATVESETALNETFDSELEEVTKEMPMTTHLLGGQGLRARVYREGNQASTPEVRNFSPAVFKNKNDFVETIAKDAKEVADSYGLYPSVMIAQAILESSYGESRLTKEANNFFGIKFTAGADEGRFGRYDIPSDEFINGQRVSLAASFRKYPSLKASLEDNGRLLANGLTGNASFYEGSWRKNATTYQQATKALTGKYATDPLYDVKLNQIIETWNLSQYD